MHKSVHLSLPQPPRLGRYGRRWWVCLVFASIAFLQGLGWNTYAPISGNYEAIYGWDNADIALLPNVQGIVVLVLAIPFGMFQHTLDLRTAVVFTSTFSAICMGFRCIPCRRSHHYYWSLASMVANGVSNSVNAVYPPALSATWFPPEERTLATAIMAAGNFLGNALGFILGAPGAPALPVHRPPAHPSPRRRSLACFGLALATNDDWLALTSELTRRTCSPPCCYAQGHLWFRGGARTSTTSRGCTTTRLWRWGWSGSRRSSIFRRTSLSGARSAVFSSCSLATFRTWGRVPRGGTGASPDRA